MSSALDSFVTYFTNIDTSSVVLTAFNDGVTSDAFVFGTNLFGLVVPSMPDNIIAIIPYDGGTSPDIERQVINPRIQVIIRHTAPKAAYDTAMACIFRLHKKGTIIDGLCLSVNSNPLSLGLDDNGRQLYSVNFALKQKYEI